ncbi:hypothetical protein [Desulforhabdus amnigena]|uniref:Uncharacterized protein n=1 Tax=Desulforhabdus amnigena TaxID=40218 RepID=A0A9W6D6E6_9BACT|nr:hypothetical protein [Desulforhabdus amnigena]GLI34481.1 hypothetical protein DAMNIGENAA_19140 [Desulforhabdus amnigena]
MKKYTIFAILAVFLFAGFATCVSAAPNVASTSKNGSLLIFPKIDVSDDRWQEKDTVVTISNEGPESVQVQCIWHYPKISLVTKQDPNRSYDGTSTNIYYKAYEQVCCGAQDFTFNLTKNQVIAFSAKKGTVLKDFGLNGTINPFPTTPASGSVGKGELRCFVVQGAATSPKPIAYNKLNGQATIYDFAKKTSEMYTAWAFNAYAPLKSVMVSSNKNDPLQLDLTGKPGAYDACPSYLSFNFLADSLENGRFGTQTEVVLVPCTQDMREADAPGDPVVPTKTVAQFSVFNADELDLSMPRACIKCWFESALTDTASYAGRQYRNIDNSGDYFKNFGFRYPRIQDAFQMNEAGDNFLLDQMGTFFGHARVDAKAGSIAGSKWCSKAEDTIATPLLGLVTYKFIVPHFRGKNFDISADADGGVVEDLFYNKWEQAYTGTTNMTGLSAQKGYMRWSTNQ